MNGRLFDIIKRDAKHFINNGGYQIDIQMISRDGSLTINITGWAVKITGSFDSDGNQVNTKNVHITVDEDVLKSKGFPVRTNKKGIEEVDFSGVKANFVDSSGTLKSYFVREQFPNENLGLVNIGLGDHKP